MIARIARPAAAALLVTFSAVGGFAPAAGGPPQREAPRNVVFILADDHRYDFMGFHRSARRPTRSRPSPGAPGAGR